MAAKNLASMGMVPELKFFDTDLSVPFDTTAEVPATGGQLVLIPQGDTQSTRDGRLAFIKSIQIRGKISLVPAAAATAASVAHMWLVLDTQANGAAAAVTDVFTSAAAQSCMLNLNNSGRFRILKHWVMKFEAKSGVTTAYNNDTKAFEFYKRCNIKVDWSGTSGAITEIRSNNLFLIAGSDGDSDDLITLSGTARVRFVG